MFLEYLSRVCIKLDLKAQTRNYFIFNEKSIALKIILDSEIDGNVKGKIYLEAPCSHCHPSLGDWGGDKKIDAGLKLT